MSRESHHENKHIQISGREPFLRKLDEIIESNLGNERFGVGELSEAMSLSRMQLYRKVLKFTGNNVSRYIREKRLRHSLEMLEDDTLTISEIAYKVGFGSASYFSNCFRKHYGYSQGQVREGEDVFDHEDKYPVIRQDSVKFPVRL